MKSAVVKDNSGTNKNIQLKIIQSQKPETTANTRKKK